MFDLKNNNLIAILQMFSQHLLFFELHFIAVMLHYVYVYISKINTFTF